MISPLFFYLFAGLAVGMVFLMIFQTNPVACALCLVVALFAMAGLYILLSAPFVGILQILVYAGAIMVLFVFVIMLLKLRPEDLEDDKVNGKTILMTLCGFVFILFVGTGLTRAPFKPFVSVGPDFGEAKAVGRLLFTNYLVPFEIISFLILVAILGVVLLASKKDQ